MSPRSRPALEVHKSTAFRLVATLEQHGLVEQVEGRGKYRLGLGLLRLAGATSARLDVVQEARPLCKQLAAATGETVNLATLSGHSALYLDQVAGPSALQPHNWVGQHIPLHATSNGKVLMAWLPRPSSMTCSVGCRRTPARPSPPSPGSSASSRSVREQGYAVAVDELEVGLTAIARPVRNAHGDVICSMSVSGPTLPPLRRAGRRGDAAAGRGCRRALPPSRLGCPLSAETRASPEQTARSRSVHES